MVERLSFQNKQFQLTAARRRLAEIAKKCGVSGSFNSQPREGGWKYKDLPITDTKGFNSQPREGGWKAQGITFAHWAVSTHSRAKAAGQ